ncbi:MAG: hypothetical protein FVQ81_12835 [Candidatus Glassbacteria bacterium]|nr:hypothetical protein [Candidatus Glassbacteria bacterium]
MRQSVGIRVSVPVLILAVLLVGNAAAQDDWGRLQTFEDGDLGRWTLKGSGRVALDSTYATQRKHNLRVEFGRGATLSVDLVGLWRMAEIIREKFGDEGGGGWKIYEAFFTDIYAPEPVGLLVTFRDSVGGVWQEVRHLKKGLNMLQFRRETLHGLDFNSLGAVSYAPAGPALLYFDHVRTWEYQPELDQRGKMDISYSDSIATPHVPWQRPDAQGAVKGLFTPRAAAGRVMVELMQRFELQPATVTFEPSLGMHRWAFGDFYGTRALGYDHVDDKFSISYTDLTSELESDKQFDVIVLTPMRGWQNWPPELRRALLERVRNGAGLVLFQPTDLEADSIFSELSPLDGRIEMEQVHLREADQPEEMPGGMRRAEWTVVDGEHYITRGIPLELVPTEDIPHLAYDAGQDQVLIASREGSPILAVGSYGRGRVAAFGWVDHGMFPVVENPLEERDGLPYWEYLYALVGRTVRWAAGRDNPESGIFSPSIRDDGGSVTVTAVLQGVFPGDSVEISLRNGAWDALQVDTLAVHASGRIEHRFVNTYHASLAIVGLRHIRSGGRVVDFASALGRTVKGPRVEAIELEAETVPLGIVLSGQVKFSGNPQRVALSLTDNRGRLLGADTVAATGGSAPFAFNTGGCLSRRAVVSVRILSPAGDPLHSLSRAVFIDRPASWDDYEVMMYRFMPMITAGEWNFLDRRMEELGVTAWAAISPEFVYRSNLGIQAETRLDTEESLDGAGEIPYRQAKTNYLKTRDKQYLHRINCLHDPQYLAEQRRVIFEKVSRFKRFSPLSYYAYEEPSLTHYGDAFDLCFSPHTLAAFREWLRGRYGSLDALDSQWGTTFAGWDEVIPDDTFEAQERGNYSSWADHRTFMEISYADNYSYVRGLVREVDDDGLVMMTGTQRTVPHNGYDYYLIDQAIDHTQPYGEPARHQAFMREGGKITGCTGYGVWGPKLDYELWSRLFAGHTAGSAIFWQFSTIDPDYRLCKSGRDMMNIFGELRHGGIAKLIAAGESTPSEVVLLWSIQSIHGSWIQDGRIIEQDGAPSAMFDRWEANYESWRRLLEDLSVPYRVIGCQMLEDGWLDGSGAEILVLPNSLALSDRAAERIAGFVRGGGALIGDSQTGQMDGHCRWRAAGALDSLFGITAEPGQVPVNGGIVQRGGGWGLEIAESDLHASAAEQLDLGPGLPLVYRNSFGDGGAYHLNTFVSGYGNLRAGGRGSAVRNSAMRLLRAAGYEPRFRLRPASGTDLKAVKMTTYNLGAGSLIGLIKDYRMVGPPRDIEVLLPNDGYHYDVRNGRYLGRGRTIRTPITTGEIKLLASLPYQVTDVALELPRRAHRGGKVQFSFGVNLAASTESSAASLPSAGPHVFVVEVYGPEGEKLGHYSGNVSTAAGRGRQSFQLALNDKPGDWRVRVRDVASGVFNEKYVEVE